MFGFVNRDQLFSVRGNGQVPVFVLRNSKVEVCGFSLPSTLGRNPDEVDMYLFDPSVSRVHLKFEMNEGRLVVTDMGSTAGTKINGVILQPNMPFYLDDNSKIVVGKVKLKAYVNFDMMRQLSQGAPAKQTEPETHFIRQEIITDTTVENETRTLFPDYPQPNSIDSTPAHEEEAVSVQPEEEEEIEITDFEIIAPEPETEPEVEEIDTNLEEDESEEAIEVIAVKSDEESELEDEEEFKIDTEHSEDNIIEKSEPEVEPENNEPEEYLEEESRNEGSDIPTVGGIPDSEEIIVEEDDDKTEVLSYRRDDNTVEMQLKWINPENGMEDIIKIEWMPFVIGRTKANTDHAINARGISRRHFFIDSTNDEYFITDLNSTNGTFVNGTRIKPMSRRHLEEGDIIGVGEREYSFERV